ncbi:MAG: type II toxin-antitoxin system HicB family antitoxin [Nanoarchaeota archaeon]
MPKKFTVIIEKDEDGWYVSEVVGLPGCHTQGKTIDQLVERTKEAISLYLKSTKDKEIYSKFVGFLQIEV